MSFRVIPFRDYPEDRKEEFDFHTLIFTFTLRLNFSQIFINSICKKIWLNINIIACDTILFLQ